MDKLSRRRFLEDSLLALGAAAAMPAASLAAPVGKGRRVGPNDRIRIAVIGVHGRGKDHVKGYAAMDDVDIVAICDPDTAVMGPAVEIVTKAGKPTPKAVQDIRRICDDKEIDAVSIATPNHWHALAAIWAMQAGKDVYVEKPVSHNVSEGRRIVEVARKLERICEAGTQSRASKGLQDAVAYLHSGQLGHIRVARGLCYKTRPSIGKVSGPQEPPATVDYNLWLGPAPMKPPMRSQFHYDWHWFWDYGNGDVGNQGIHEMDKARWGLGQKGLPQNVLALGGRFGYVDDGQTPNTLLVFHDYGDSQLIFEVRGLVQNLKDGVDPARAYLKLDPKRYLVGNVFYGEKGVMVMPSYADAVVFDNDGNKVTEFHGGGNHFRNFVNAMRSRKQSDLFADIEEGHVSSALCHLGNISYKLGKEEPFNKKTKAFGDNKEAYETFGRFEEHLAANDVKLEDATYKLGRHLKVDPDHESFRGDHEAVALLTREYREPFVVPSKA